MKECVCICVKIVCVLCKRKWVCVWETELEPLFPNKSSFCSADGRMKRSCSNCRAAFRSQMSGSHESMRLNAALQQQHMVTESSHDPHFCHVPVFKTVTQTLSASAFTQSFYITPTLMYWIIIQLFDLEIVEMIRVMFKAACHLIIHRTMMSS